MDGSHRSEGARYGDRKDVDAVVIGPKEGTLDEGLLLSMFHENRDILLYSVIKIDTILVSIIMRNFKLTFKVKIKIRPPRCDGILNGLGRY